jgi:predicted RNase H-like HicB family nuclease
MIDLSDYPYELAPLPEAEGGGYVARFPDIPGCLGVGDTEKEAIADAQKALFACLDALKAVGRAAPAPSAQPG